MTRRPDDALRFIQDILDEMDEALGYVEGTSKQTFQQDERTVRAVIRCLEVIGEATKQIPEELRERYEGIPWREMAGMRDRLIHAYWEVDRDLVWEAVDEEIPRLRPKLAQLLEKERD